MSFPHEAKQFFRICYLLLFRGMSETHNPAALWNRTYTWEMKRLSLSDWFGDCLAVKIYD